MVPQKLVNTAIEKHYAQDLHATNNCSQLKYTQSIENKLAIVYFSEFAKVYCSEHTILLLRAAILLLRAYCYYF